jgi:serine/threonine-protein kinase
MAADPSDVPPTLETTGVATETPRPVSSLELGSAETMPVSAGHVVLKDKRVGRFTITELLGRGGMGEVYAAHDPELDRKVAIKLLRPEMSTQRADARLRREARSMARLPNTNPDPVQAVGGHDGQLFVAMEMIAGDTLRGWQQGKPWRDIVGAYVAAGRGLASAHDAGIIHRDFKPDNVLVGKDGRVAVGDFGLAMSASDDAPDGALAGTVRYMAPEQLERRLTDARSDQFAFCLALWEALDRDPFGAVVSTEDIHVIVDGRSKAIAAGPLRKPPGVPAWITKALVRGLAVNPADRWPSMTALLDHIDPARRRNRIVIAAAVGTLAVAIGATWWLSAPAADPCRDAAAAMTTVWKPGSVQRLRDAFAGTKRANAEEAATRTAALLDRRSAAWTLEKVSSCSATARGNQNADIDRRRTRCLDARLAELSAFVTALTHGPTGEMIDQAMRVANALPSVDECSKVDALLERTLPQAAAQGEITKLELDVARADTLEKLGDKPTIASLPALRDRAKALDWAPALAHIDAVIGHEAFRRGDGASSIETLREGATAAARAKDDDLGARVLSLESGALLDADRASEAVEVAHAAELLVARAGDPPALRADALDALATAYTALSKFDEADKAYAAAVELLAKADVDRFDQGRLLNSWANQLNERSDYARALPLSDRALAILRTELGDHHPDYARALQSNANILMQIGRYPQAKAELEQALAIKQAIYGDSEPTVAMTLHSLGGVEQFLGDHQRAHDLFTRAYEIWSKALGPDHSLTLMARYSLGQNLKHLGKPKEAIEVLTDVLARRSAAKNPQQEKIANTLDAIASVYIETGDPKPALPYAERALAIREKVLGPSTGDVALSLTMLAQIHGEIGDCTKASAAASRAVTILHGIPDGDEQAGLPTLVLAMCTDDVAKARPLYQRAGEMLANNANAEHELTIVHTWLAKHPERGK